MQHILGLFQQVVYGLCDYGQCQRRVLPLSLYGDTVLHTFIPRLITIKLELQDCTTIDRNTGDIVQVIGAGLPPMGTSSLVGAMEILGFGPSFHFTEVVCNPEYASTFSRLSA